MSSVSIEDPRQPEIESMLRQGESFALSLYPAEGCFLLNIDELLLVGVSVFVARGPDGTALGMAALVDRHDGTGELKRLFVAESGRGQGVATMIMNALEAAARAQSIHTLQLETGAKHQAATALYASRGYETIDRFGPYVASGFSVCMQKLL